MHLSHPEFVSHTGFPFSHVPVMFMPLYERIRPLLDGLSKIDLRKILDDLQSSLSQDSSLKDQEEVLLSTLVMTCDQNPPYSKLAARILSLQIKEEVGPQVSFADYLREGLHNGLLHPSLERWLGEEGKDLSMAFDHSRDGLFEYFGIKTLMDRYLLRHRQTRKLMERPQWLFMRVAMGLSGDKEEILAFYHMISQFYYMPATPTLFNSGTGHPQMSSCFLLTAVEDSLEGIYETITDCAKLSKFAGGLGVDWTPVRAAGGLIRGTNGTSNGIIPFLKVFDSSVHAVNQGGKRKGAAAIYLEPWHGDIESFLELKNNTGAEERRTHNLNLALWIPDLFMKRVEENASWSLFSPHQTPELIKTFGEEFEGHYHRYEKEGLAIKTVSARNLYIKMMETLASTGNGWMCFKDHCNRRSPQVGASKAIIRSSNLCTEILEVTDSQETAVCNLGSLNLKTFVTSEGIFDFNLLREKVRLAVRFLDKVIDINFYPTAKAQQSNHKWRPIGLGLMGLQDVLFLLRLPFSSPEAKELSTRISATIYHEALLTSMELARQEGSFPGFAESQYPTGKLQVHLAGSTYGQDGKEWDWDGLGEKIKTHGLRNSLLVAIAPTATIASLVGSYESIEPQVSNIFKRETLSGEFLQINRYLVTDLQELGLWTPALRDKIIAREGSIQGLEEIPFSLRDLYKTAWEIPQKDLIDMSVARAAFICQSQSLNLFMEDPNLAKLSSMYMYAWKRGVKTTYYLRSRAKTFIQKTTISSSNTNTSAAAAIACSLENPETCEVCQ